VIEDKIMKPEAEREEFESISSPCVRHVCSKCCVDTQMTLVESDVRSLEEAGYSDFCFETCDGSLQLRNNDSRCVFLTDLGCNAYEHRPEGCRLYPLVLDMGSDQVITDDFCPYRAEFRFSAADRASLRASVEREELEAKTRKASRRRRRETKDVRQKKQEVRRKKLDADDG
jgi:Fe-S-cluster containining protein